MKKDKDQDIYDLFKQIYEDIVMAAGAEGSGPANGIVSPEGAEQSSVPKGVMTTDILGKCDHEKNGFFGKDCFHIPKNIFKKPLRRFDYPLKRRKKDLD